MKAPADPDLVGLLCRWFSVPFLVTYFLASITAIFLSIRKRRAERRAVAGEMVLTEAMQADSAAEHSRPTMALDLGEGAGAQGG